MKGGIILGILVGLAIVIGIHYGCDGYTADAAGTVTSPGRVELTGGLDQQPCANGFFFVVTPVSKTEILSITLNFGSGPQSVSFVLGPNDGQATVTDGAGRTIVSGFAIVDGATEHSRFNLSHCAGTPTTPTPTPTPTPFVTPTPTPCCGSTPTPTPVVTPTPAPTDSIVPVATSVTQAPIGFPDTGGAPVHVSGNSIFDYALYVLGCFGAGFVVGGLLFAMLRGR